MFTCVCEPYYLCTFVCIQATTMHGDHNLMNSEQLEQFLFVCL
jgi:hypothetical protein